MAEPLKSTSTLLRRLGDGPSGAASIVDLVAGFVAVGCFGHAGLRRLFARHD